MVSHHPAEFGDDRHCGSGDIMFLVAEEEDFRCSRLNPSLMFISKGHGFKAHVFKAVIGQKFKNNSCQSV